MLSSTSVRKGIRPKEIHESFMETLGDEAPYNTVRKWAADFKIGRETGAMMDCLTAQNMSGLKKYEGRVHPGFVW